MNKNITELGKHLRKIRTDRGETAKDMARNLGITPAYLSAVEIGKRKISINLKDKIIDKYCLSKEDADIIEDLIIQDSTSLKLFVDHLDLEKKKILLAFISQIKELSEEDINKIRKIIE